MLAWIADRWGALQMKVFSHVANRNRRTIVVVFGIKKEIPVNSLSLLSTMLFAALVMATVATFTTGAFAAEHVIYSFTGGSDGTNSSELIADRAGNLYGTTLNGGSAGAGTVFELSPPTQKGGAWTKTVFYSFYYAGDSGIGPMAGLVMDEAGNLYGTTWLGGPAGGGGIVFELSRPVQGGTWTFSTLYGFGSYDNDLESPEAPLVLDKAGNLYGTTTAGGTGNCIGGCGGVFQLAAPAQPGDAWTETVLHSFPGTPFGPAGGAVGGVIIDANGALYGAGFAPAKHDGLVYRLTPPKTKHGRHWAYDVLYAFAGGSDGSAPSAPLVFDKSGNLYGTTSYGGSATCIDGYPCGTVFQLAPNPTGPWTHTVLYSFKGGTDGSYYTPGAGLTIDAWGNLYGPTSAGGGSGCSAGFGCGTVFKLAPPVVQGGSWAETILYRFEGGSKGAVPGALTFGKGKLLYGPALNETSWYGLIFSVNR